MLFTVPPLAAAGLLLVQLQITQLVTHFAHGTGRHHEAGANGARFCGTSGGHQLLLAKLLLVLLHGSVQDAGVVGHGRGSRGGGCITDRNGGRYRGWWWRGGSGHRQERSGGGSPGRHAVMVVVMVMVMVEQVVMAAEQVADQGGFRAGVVVGVVIGRGGSGGRRG